MNLKFDQSPIIEHIEEITIEIATKKNLGMFIIDIHEKTQTLRSLI